MCMSKNKYNIKIIIIIIIFYRKLQGALLMQVATTINPSKDLRLYYKVLNYDDKNL